MAISARKPAPFTEPGHCLILPSKFSDDEYGGVDLQTEVEGRGGPLYLWLSGTGVRQLAAKFPKFRLVDRSALEEAESALALADAELEQSKARIAELEAQLEGIHGLARAGYTVNRKPRSAA